MHLRRLKLVTLSLQFILVSLCLWWGVHYLNWVDVLEQCSKVSPIMILIVFAQRYTPYVMLGLRLTTLFPHRVRLMDGFQASVLCVGCNNILPARMGELVKMVCLHNSNNLTYPTLFCGILLERLLDLSMLMVLTLCFALSFANHAFVGVFVGLLTATWLVLWHIGKTDNFLQTLVCRLPLPIRIRSCFDQFCISFKKQLKLQALLLPVGVTCLVWAMNYLHVYLLSNQLMGLELSLNAVGLLCVSLFFSGALLIVPGGIGVMEASVFAVLSLLGVDATKAASTALWARLYYSIPPLLGAVGIVLKAQSSLAATLAKFSDGIKTLRKNEYKPQHSDIL